MAWALKFNPDGTSGGDYVTFGSSIANNAGTSAWVAEFKVKFASYPTTGNWYILGSNNASASGLALRQGSGNGALAIVTAGTFRIASNAGFILNDAEFHVYRVEHDANGDLRFYRDGTQFGPTLSFVLNSLFNCNRFGAGTTTATVFTPFEMDYFTYIGSPNGRTWRASLSNGAGVQLPTDESSNEGTLFGFAAGAEWVFYSDGSTESASIDSTYPKYTAAVTGTNTKPVFNTSVNSTYGKYTGTVSAGVVTPGINASISANYPKYTSTVTGSNIKPVRSASISSSYGKYTATVTATNIKPVRPASVNSTYSKHTASINAGIVSTNRQISINSTYPKYTGSVTGSNTKPVFNGSVNSTYVKHTASVTGNNTKPVLTTTINSSYGKHTVNVSIGGVYLNRTASVNSTYAKHTASVAASLLLQDRSCTINGSYPKHFAVVIQGQVNLTTKAGTGRNLDISFGSRNYQYYAGLREITVEV